MLELRERIIGGTRFDVMARMYSVDPGTSNQGGEMDFMPLDALVKPFADALSKLQPGQISEIVETENGFHIIQLIEKKGNLYKCRHILLKPIFTPEELTETNVFLDSLANRIRIDSVTFEKAAMQHSDDKYSNQNGGVVTNHEFLEQLGYGDTSYSQTKFSRDDLGQLGMEGDYMIIRDLRPGEISDAAQAADLRGNVLGKIIKLIEIIPAHPAGMKDDYLRIEQMALQDKQMKEFRAWVDNKIGSMYIRIEPEFRNGEFENKNWVK
jgi:peptidyl-prolyl cis-trans isomerase SurA